MTGIYGFRNSRYGLLVERGMTNTIILQSGRTPGAWLVQADGANLHRVADGKFPGVMTQSR